MSALTLLTFQTLLLFLLHFTKWFIRSHLWQSFPKVGHLLNLCLAPHLLQGVEFENFCTKKIVRFWTYSVSCADIWQKLIISVLLQEEFIWSFTRIFNFSLSSRRPAMNWSLISSSEDLDVFKRSQSQWRDVSFNLERQSISLSPRIWDICKKLMRSAICKRSLGSTYSRRHVFMSENNCFSISLLGIIDINFKIIF